MRFKSLIHWLLLGLLASITACDQSSQDDSGSPKFTNELIQLNAIPAQHSGRPVNYSKVSKEITAVTVADTSETTAADLQIDHRAPDRAGWRSEHLNAEIGDQLRQLSGSREGLDFATLVAPSYSGTQLVPRDIGISREQNGIKILSGKEFPLSSSFEESLNFWIERFSKGNHPSLRFKLVKISPSDSRISSQILVEITGSQESGDSAQGNGVWECQWLLPDAESPPLLESLKVTQYEEVLSQQGALFRDATLAAFLDANSFHSQMMHGISFWSERLTRIDDMAITGHHGLALGDVNNDGLEDLYVCDAGGLPNRLYIQNADGSVTDSSASLGVDFLEDSRSALFLDLDNDGDQDLVVGTVALILFAENDGKGRFDLIGGHTGAPSAIFDDSGGLRQRFVSRHLCLQLRIRKECHLGRERL